MSIPKEELLVAKLEARGASHSAMGMLTNSLPLLYDQLAENYFNYYEFGKSMLADVAKGEIAGLVTHLPQDFTVLSQTLSQYRQPLKIGAVICPDWNGHYEGNTFVYDMNGFGSGTPQTAYTVKKYLETLSRRANQDGVSIQFTGHFPGWEFTRSGITHGIPQSQALKMLSESAWGVKHTLSPLEHKNLSVDFKIHTPPDFHDNVDRMASALIHSGSRKVTAVFNGRQSFHKGNYSPEAAAKEYAEAKHAWTLLGSEDIILVATSPTIARACLSEGSQAWIQLQTGYRG